MKRKCEKMRIEFQNNYKYKTNDTETLEPLQLYST